MTHADLTSTTDIDTTSTANRLHNDPNIRTSPQVEPTKTHVDPTYTIDRRNRRQIDPKGRTVDSTYIRERPLIDHTEVNVHRPQEPHRNLNTTPKLVFLPRPPSPRRHDFFCRAANGRGATPLRCRPCGRPADMRAREHAMPLGVRRSSTPEPCDHSRKSHAHIIGHPRCRLEMTNRARHTIPKNHKPKGKPANHQRVDEHRGGSASPPTTMIPSRPGIGARSGRNWSHDAPQEVDQ